MPENRSRENHFYVIYEREVAILPTKFMLLAAVEFEKINLRLNS